ncbi:hypothetical protein Metlim_1892 [Methanoplanus limicola DSM 2279]|uniref:Uncharacterized protein n=1 Tax=Methanoplanus limicola DSM 2279 TaxID=937775 RepID=H1YYK9_9EURY|nr:hypothetical protein Metlim_1892 [Methanoplanus limicola DSM 2279]
MKDHSNMININVKLRKITDKQVQTEKFSDMIQKGDYQ